jgi:hypothetical protein
MSLRSAKKRKTIVRKLKNREKIIRGAPDKYSEANIPMERTTTPKTSFCLLEK